MNGGVSAGLCHIRLLLGSDKEPDSEVANETSEDLRLIVTPWQKNQVTLCFLGWHGRENCTSAF
jgi:hypothetical protein